MMRRYGLIGLLALLVLAGCAPHGIGPAGPSVAAGPGEDGIGGTGIRPSGTDPDPWGDGVGGTGVFGTVTGLGSIHVNGLRIELPAPLAARPLIAGSPAARPGVGHTVAVTLAPGADARAVLSLVSVFPLIGPVEIAADGSLTVMGTPVQVEQVAGSGITDLAPGDRVAVSGLWRSGAVIASRLERVGSEVPDVTAGLLRRAGGRWRIGDTTLDLGCCEQAIAGGFVAVAGRYRDGVLMAQRLERGAGALFAAGVRNLLVEAFLARNPDGQGYHLSGFGIPMDPDSRIQPSAGRRAIFAGRLERMHLLERESLDRSFLIERVQPLPEAAPERLLLLEEKALRGR